MGIFADGGMSAYKGNSYTIALIELPSGQMSVVSPEHIKFNQTIRIIEDIKDELWLSQEQEDTL
jgi:hypothetical protein